MTRGSENSPEHAICEELTGVRSRPQRQDEQIPESTDPELNKALDRWKLFGLAFSGGGIRSATFNLGVIQALEEMGLLQYVDYLSTVSGGGYIGSWYLSCLKARLANGEPARAIDHLRKFSRYLAPEAGLFSADTWTIAMVWLRNTLLLQATLVSLFAVLLLLPRYFEWGFLHLPASWTTVAAAALFTQAAIQTTYRLGRMKEADRNNSVEGDAGKAGAPELVDGQATLQYAIVLPLLVAAACFCSALWQAHGGKTLLWWASGAVAVATYCTAMFSLLRYVRYRLKWIVGAGAIGVLCGGLFFGLSSMLASLYTAWAVAGPATSGPWLAGLLGAPALLISLALTVVLQIGLLGRAIDDSRREWWSRLGAFLTIYSAAALALDAAALYGPLWVARLGNWASALSLGGLATTVGGLMAARSRDTSGVGKQTGKEWLAAIAPYVFIAGLLLAASTGVHYVLTRLQMGHFPAISDMPALHWLMFDGSIGFQLDGSIGAVSGTLLEVTMASLGILALLAWRVDINEASMNPFYRNRLVRCYLGAARAAKQLRRPNLFTGFDFADDYALGDLQTQYGYQGPVPIINSALNLTGADNAALEERRATSFFFTPYESGSARTGVGATDKTGKFERGIRLGTCVATSGAAASPNMGYHTSAPVAFLMTFFNVRLGLWMRNPLFPAAQQRARWGLWYLLKELFATASADDRYVYLSDGGHFENLGVYELVRRRCRYIIACDAEQDEKLVMEGLGGLVRKCRIDFNAEIEIDTSQIRKIDEKGRSAAHCAVGRIQYHNPDAEGYLVYLKASLTGDEDSDILQYKAQNSAFPHESTGDQFFTESQFESYRFLGDHIAHTAFQGAFQTQPAGAPETALVASRNEIENLMESVKAIWQPPSPYTERRFAHHAEELSRLWDEIRKGDAAFNLDRELFPGWNLDPGTQGHPSIRRGLYLCQTILQLMENVYLDLHLESEWEHPDNEGWRALFLHWAASPTLQEVYENSSGTYGGRFRQFCEKRLNLRKPDAPEPEPREKASKAAAGSGSQKAK